MILALLCAATTGFRSIPLTLDELANRAECVVHARVVSKQCEEDARGQIFTKINLDLLEVWKGRLDTTRCQIVHGGGVLGDQETRVSGQVHYHIGEEMIAFLKRNEAGEWITVGLAQGKLRVQHDGAAKAAERAEVAVRLHRDRANLTSGWTRITLEVLRKKLMEPSSPGHAVEEKR